MKTELLVVGLGYWNRRSAQTLEFAEVVKFGAVLVVVCCGVILVEERWK